MKTAIVYDWLVSSGGAEHVLEEALQVLPDADLFTLCDFLPVDERGFLGDRRITTSFLQKLPFARSRYRHYLALMPLAVEQFDLSAYDLVLSISSAVAKGVITGPDQVHVAYVNTPMRYAWDLTHLYLNATGMGRGPTGLVTRMVLHYMRMWDVQSAARADVLIANSHYVAGRIRKTYGRKADVIHPPVAVDNFPLGSSRDEFYLTVSRIVPYKRIDLLVEAFAAMPQRQLVVIGEGPGLRDLRKNAPINVRFLGRQSHEIVKDHLQRARAFLFAAEEDFGIAPLEAQACGTPVVAFGKGGILETVIDRKTGVLFPEQSADSLVAAICTFENLESTFERQTIREHTLPFAQEHFRQRLTSAIDQALTQHRKTRRHAQPPPMDAQGGEAGTLSSKEQRA